ncbi:hypothetical protein ONZ45_g18418 [Pleurotus djamor]|nr:hypothetical protein ONZ45_g18418 [Pleurotus djamor]
MYLISPEGVYTYTRPTFEGYEACVQPLLPPGSPRLWALIASRYNGFVTDVPLNLLTPELFLVYASSTSSCNHKPLLDNSVLDGPPIILKPWSPRELRKYMSKLIQIHGRRIGPAKFTKIYVTFGPDDRDILRALYEVEKGTSRKKQMTSAKC